MDKMVTTQDFSVSHCPYRHFLPEIDVFGVSFAVYNADVVCTPGRLEEPSEDITRVFCDFREGDYRNCPAYVSVQRLNEITSHQRLITVASIL